MKIQISFVFRIKSDLKNTDQFCFDKNNKSENTNQF